MNKFLTLLFSVLALTFVNTNVYAALDYPSIDPTAFTIFGFEVKWYGLFYIIGLAGAITINYFFLKYEHNLPNSNYNKNVTNEYFIDVAVYAFLAAIVGGRIFYVLFYNFSYYLQHPIEIFYVHQGGMSFHGGFTGAVVGIYLATRKQKNFWQIADMGASVIPFALLVGRIANFINDELWGRATDVAWAIKFPSGGYIPRHPSQLYESFLEGFVILIVVAYLRTRRLNRAGLLSGCFIAGYAIARIIVEFFREADAQIGYYFGTFTQGQLLSLPMLVVGVWLIISSKNRPYSYFKN